MSSKLRQNLINELSELSISLSDTLELVGETDLESNEMTATHNTDITSSNAEFQMTTLDTLTPDTNKV